MQPFMETRQRVKLSSEMFIGISDGFTSDRYVAWDSNSDDSLGDPLPHLLFLPFSRAVSLLVTKCQDASGPWDLLVSVDTSITWSRDSLGLCQLVVSFHVKPSIQFTKTWESYNSSRKTGGWCLQSSAVIHKGTTSARNVCHLQFYPPHLDGGERWAHAAVRNFSAATALTGYNASSLV